MPAVSTINRELREVVMEARQAIEESNAMFVQAYNRGDAAACAANFLEDGAILAPNQPAVLGKQAVEGFFKGMIEELGGTGAIEILEVDAAGDLAYQSATYSFESNEGSDAGKFVEVYKRQADGSWKIRLTIFNSDNPPPASD
jgi:ketosteroid isomerase-like protein